MCGTLKTGEIMGLFDKFNTQSKQVIANLELEINELKKTISAQEQELTQKSNEIRNLEYQLTQKVSRNHNLQQQLSEKSNKIHDLELELEMQNNNLLAKTNSIRQLFYEKEQLNAAISEKNAFIHTQTIHLQAVETAHMECLKKSNDLELLNQNFSEKIRKLEKQKTDAIHSANIKLMELQKELNFTTSEKNILEDQLQTLKEKYAPLISIQNYEFFANLQKNELEKQIYLQKFLFVLKNHHMERALQSKQQEFRARYKKIKIAAEQAIEKYERDMNEQEFKLLRPYISVSDFYSYSVPIRNQMALDNYNRMKKTPIEIGLAYERYIGYLYEMQNYEVRYHGALNKFKDKGIDLYAIRKKEVLVIQCKRWSKNTMVGDATIRELHGSIGIAQTKFPSRQIKGILYTTTKVSEEAKKEAKTLGIKIFEEFPIEEYPMIKCNVSESGEKIYHLPFDQMYDKTFITPKNGDLYVATVTEAELYGFRHAHRWDPSKNH